MRSVRLTLAKRQTVGIAISGLSAWMREFISEVDPNRGVSGSAGDGLDIGQYGA